MAQVGRRATREFQRAQSSRLSKYNGSQGFAKANQYWSIGASAGYANYFGDLAPDRSAFSTVYDQTTPYFGLFVAKRVSPHLEIKGNVGYFRIAADDNNVEASRSVDNTGRYIRGLHFQNNIFEAGLTLKADLLPSVYGPARRNPFNGYGFVGLSVFTNNPQALGPKGTELADTWVDLRPLRTEGQATAYGLVNIGIPLGIGASYKLTSNIDVSLEMGYRITFTNHLDDVGGPYPTASALRNMTPTARSLSMRSGERFAAATGADRFNTRLNDDPNNKFAWSNVGPLRINNQPVLDADGNPLTGIEGSPLVVYRGNESGGAPRGGSGRDYVFITALNLTYIIPDAKRGTRARF